MKYFIKTFGCQQNTADSERIASLYKFRGMTKAKNYQQADQIIINTCMVRQSAENRVYGLIENLKKIKNKSTKKPKIILTGCLVGLAMRDKTGKYLKRLREKMPEIDEFLPVEEVGFDYQPIRQDKINAWVPISNGCNNFCTYCVVPFTRGREISRPYKDIIKECRQLKRKGYKNITLLGQNVNSYGADLILGRKKVKIPVSNDPSASLRTGLGCLPRVIGGRKSTGVRNMASSFLKKIKPIYVKHLGRYRIPTFFPYLLEDVAKIGFEKVDFISSNPWDFSDELIKVIARNKNITRTIHLPVQSGDNNVLKRMNRWYTHDEYLQLVTNLKLEIKNLKLTTDIIVGFCGETDEEFENTVKICKTVGFEQVYIGRYSPRPFTYSIKKLKDDVSPTIKKKRWQILENLVNKPNLKKK